MLLEEYTETHRETIKQLMIKYGLLVLLTTGSSDGDTTRPVLRRAFTRAKTAKHVYDDLADGDDDKEEEVQNIDIRGQEQHQPTVKDTASAASDHSSTTNRRYLAPALLPDQPTTPSSTTSSFQSSFYFIFAASAELTRLSTITTADCRTFGFLPTGIFEKLIGKAVTWSLQTSNHISSQQREEVQLHSIYKNHAELAFGNQLFSIAVLPDLNAIFVQVEGSNPVIVHDRLKD